MIRPRGLVAGQCDPSRVIPAPGSCTRSQPGGGGTVTGRRMGWSSAPAAMDGANPARTPTTAVPAITDNGTNTRDSRMRSSTMALAGSFFDEGDTHDNFRALHKSGVFDVSDGSNVSGQAEPRIPDPDPGTRTIV